MPIELAATALVVTALLVPAITKLSRLIRFGGSITKRLKRLSHLLVVTTAITYILAAALLVAHLLRAFDIVQHVAVATVLAVLALVPYPVVMIIAHLDPDWDEDE